LLDNIFPELKFNFETIEIYKKKSIIIIVPLGQICPLYKRIEVCVMDIYEIHHLVAQDGVELLTERNSILDYTSRHEPIGRRKLSLILNIPERKLRNHIDYLCRQGLLEMDSRGVMLTAKGKNLLPELQNYCVGFNQMHHLEKQLKQVLGVLDVIVVQGDLSQDICTQENLGNAAMQLVQKHLNQIRVLGVSGGSTLNLMAKKARECALPQLTVVPIRGVVSSTHTYEANFIAYRLGKAFKCRSYQLNAPDSMNSDMALQLSAHPDIQQVTSFYNYIDMVVFGIGSAEGIAKRRGYSKEKTAQLLQKGAIAEGLGYFIDGNGDALTKVSGIGLSLLQLEQIPVKIAMSGGQAKAKAIEAFSRFRKDFILITDESASKAILKNNNII